MQRRLGQHFEFQAAQRLAQNRLEEECAQSGGKKWFMKTDKADQSKTKLPTVWSQLATSFFKEGDRIVTGIIGSMWHGLLGMTHHVRTVFEDCSHGSEMQCSHILLNLHEAVVAEGHLPEVFYIGADNTPKETKNGIVCLFVVWLLCVLHKTPLVEIHMVFLMVGHTHDMVDQK